MDRPANAQRIRDLRIAHGLTLEALARRLGVSKESVRLWEAGKGLRGPNVLKLAREFDVDPGELLDRGGDEHLEQWEADPYPTRSEFFREHGEQLDADEADHLRRLRYRGDPGEFHWADELLRYRKINARIAGALEAKLDRAKDLAKERIQATSAPGEVPRARVQPGSDLTVEKARNVLRRHLARNAVGPGETTRGRRREPNDP